LLRNLYLLVIYLSFFAVGMGAPFVLTLGYEWVDFFRPQSVVFGLQDIPFAFLIGGAAIGSYLLFDRRSPPRIGAITILTILFCLWVTLTTTWAVVPDKAWIKWDWAFKSIAFGAFIPFVIRSRNQIEAFLQVYVFSLAANTIPFGIKTIINGGGYSVPLGLLEGNTSLGESATLATAGLVTVPIVFFLMKHGRIFPPGIWTKLAYIGLVVFSLATAVGTYERTALVGMFVLAGAVWISTKRKILFAALCVAVGVAIVSTASSAWMDRMVTINAPDSDSSAASRLGVWKWTYDFALDHPFGGGFDVYRVNRIAFTTDENAADGSPKAIVEYGRAFHSIYFEVLGEQGWVGLVIFLLIFLLSIASLRKVSRLAKRNPALAWAKDLSYALQSSLFVILACGAFIGIAFLPFLYYLSALSVSLREYVRRLERQKAPVLLEPNGQFSLARL
jgi:probable O-glycosylation ligase (exosortase A-associated)